MTYHLLIYIHLSHFDLYFLFARYFFTRLTIMFFDCRISKNIFLFKFEGFIKKAAIDIEMSKFKCKKKSKIFKIKNGIK